MNVSFLKISIWCTKEQQNLCEMVNKAAYLL